MNPAALPARRPFDAVRAGAIFDENRQSIFHRTDRLLLWLMVGQWLAGMIAASLISPPAWVGETTYLHPHVWAAVLLGGVIAALPVALAACHPGRPITRQAMAAGQMLMSALFIHLSGGRIETHFHIFGSLAILAFYRDWRVLATASAVVAADHFARGLIWPQSVYGVPSAPAWRAFEHAGWIIFEDVFLWISIRQSVSEMHGIAERQAKLEFSNAGVEQTVTERTITLTNEVVERRKAEKSLIASEQRFRELAETIQDVFWITSADMHEIIYVSPAREKIWGRTDESLQAQPLEWVNAIIAEDRARVLAAFTDPPADGSMIDVEYRIRRPDGEVRWILDHGFPVFDETGRCCRVAGIARDITDHKRMQASILESGKLETVGRLAGGIAHDFNTILTTIIGHAELISQAVPRGGPECQSADQIGKSARRAAQLTQQLLAFASKQMFQSEVLDLNTTVRDIEPLLRGALGGRVAVRLVLNARHTRAKADPRQIQRVLVQLASNARDAMPAGGKFLLETGDVELSEGDTSLPSGVVPGAYAMIAVTDTGTGIADEVKPRIFDPFFTTKPVGEGTGLGLSMCYGIARQLGGHIAVSSAPGCGATFRVYLPRVMEALSEPGEAARGRATTTNSPKGWETILLVGVDDSMRRPTAKVLEMQGYAVHQAGDNFRAVEIAGHLPRLDLLITDLSTCGKELAATLRSAQTELKVIYVGDQEAGTNATGSGDARTHFLPRPYSPTLLARQVREALGNHIFTAGAGVAS